MAHGSTMFTHHYTLDYLQQVFQGNDAMVLRILDVFEEEVPKYFDAMERLGQEGRWRELHPLAHKAKSSIGLLGMHALLEKVLLIETLSRSGKDDQTLLMVLNSARQLLDAGLGALSADRRRQSPQPEQENGLGTKGNWSDQGHRMYRA